MADTLRTALFAKLNGDATLTAMLATTTAIYHKRAPLNAAFPFIVYQKQSGTPIWTFGGKPVSDQRWMIKGVTRSNSASVGEDIDKRLDVILTDPVITMADGSLLFMRRESDIDYPEEGDQDYIIHHIGGSYRIEIQRT